MKEFYQIPLWGIMKFLYNCFSIKSFYIIFFTTFYFLTQWKIKFSKNIKDEVIKDKHRKKNDKVKESFQKFHCILLHCSNYDKLLQYLKTCQFLTTLLKTTSLSYYSVGVISSSWVSSSDEIVVFWVMHLEIESWVTISCWFRMLKTKICK